MCSGKPGEYVFAISSLPPFLPVAFQRGLIFVLAHASISLSSAIAVGVHLRVSMPSQTAKAPGSPKVAMRSHRRQPSTARNGEVNNTAADTKKTMAEHARNRFLINRGPRCR
jgi:hypothetical protein